MKRPTTATFWCGAICAVAAIPLSGAALLAALDACGGASTSKGFPSGDDGDDASPGDASTGNGLDGGRSTIVPVDSGPVFRSGDASVGGGDSVCDLGAASSSATNADLNLFGQIVYFEDGGTLPAGRYRATYVDGCMKYDYVFNWQVQASAPSAGGGGFWFVGETSDDRIVMPPGVTTSYADFDACVGANLATPPEDFDFDGGKMGIWLNDNPYVDNVAGQDGRNPKWRVTLLATCPPNLAPQ